jgi:hypothetical protein
MRMRGDDYTEELNAGRNIEIHNGIIKEYGGKSKG